MPELCFFFCLIISKYALFLSACFFISVPTLTSLRIRSKATKLNSNPATWKAKETKTMIESNTDMKSLRNLKPVANSRRKISTMKKSSRIRFN